MTSVLYEASGGVADVTRIVGAVIAGGRGARLGGAKVTAELEGRPLVEHAVDALRAVCGEVVVVAKERTQLPALDVAVWRDDAGADFHPRHGIVAALRGAGGAPVLVLAVDLPRVRAEDLRALLAPGRIAVARGEGRLQPLCGLYTPDALATLDAAPPGEALTATVLRLDPVVVDLPPESLLNINTPADLLDAARTGTHAGCGDPPSS